ncbi:MAG: cupin domain-containing protein, partial [Planctomycetota bacterium]
LHVHSLEDETFYIIDGSLEARVGDERHTLHAGDAVFLPRGIKHRLLCLSEEAKVVMLIHPPGLEQFFDEIDRLTADGPADPQEMQTVAAKYGVTIFPGE